MVYNSLQAYCAVEMWLTDGKGKNKSVMKVKSHRLLGKGEHERERRKAKERIKGTKKKVHHCAIRSSSHYKMNRKIICNRITI